MSLTLVAVGMIVGSLIWLNYGSNQIILHLLITPEPGQYFNWPFNFGWWLLEGITKIILGIIMLATGIALLDCKFWARTFYLLSCPLVMIIPMISKDYWFQTLGFLFTRHFYLVFLDPMSLSWGMYFAAAWCLTRPRVTDHLD